MPNSTLKQSGFTLVEVLIATFILASALLGYAATQATSLKNAKSSYYRTQATQLAADLIDRIRTNNNEEALTAYKDGGEDPGVSHVDNNCLDYQAGCTPAAMAQTDLKQWSDNITAAIPRATGKLEEAGGLYTITITWGDSAAIDPENPNTSFTTTFRL